MSQARKLFALRALSFFALSVCGGSDPVVGVNDSKKLTEPQREHLFAQLTASSSDTATSSASASSFSSASAPSAGRKMWFTTCEISHTEIDRINILQATLKAMTQCVKGEASFGCLSRFECSIHSGCTCLCVLQI
jgi:ribonuclease HII